MGFDKDKGPSFNSPNFFDMKIFLTLTSCLFFLGIASAQTPEDLKEYNRKRLQINRRGLGLLSGWAIANMASGGLLMLNASGERRYFYQMNLLWNVVNAGLAIPGFIAAGRTDPASFGIYESLEEQASVEKLFLLNAGLDVGYMALGLYLRERGQRSTTQADLLKGYGSSIILQGAFLFAFDGAMYFIQHHHASKSKHLWENLRFSGNSASLVWYF
jgi:hypothetical protein